MHPSPAHRRTVRSTIVIGALALAPVLGACSSSDDTATTTTSSAAPTGTGTTPATTAISDEERLAEAKTVAVGFFEAQAVNDYERARERSTGAAALTIDWAEAVNGIQAAEGSGYQVPAVTSPNVRVQVDALTAGPDDTWTGTGFVELSFRPGPVASTTTTTAVTSTETTAPRSPSTFVVDLTFEGDGDEMRLVDYRLDDLPYPVSQLFVELQTPDAEAGSVSGSTILGHRDLDGSVQYVVQVEADEAAAAPERAVFTPAPEGSPPGTALLPVGPDSITATTFADPLVASTPASVLVVLPGAFPGTAGTLTLATGGSDPTTTTTAGAPVTTLSWALPAWPELTPRPVDTVEVPTSATSSTSTSSTSTTTSTSTPASSTTAPTTTAPTTTRPTSTTTSSSTTTSTTTAP